MLLAIIIAKKLLERFTKKNCKKQIKMNLGYKKKLVIRRKQVYFSSTNTSTDTTVIIKD